MKVKDGVVQFQVLIGILTIPNLCNSCLLEPKFQVLIGILTMGLQDWMQSPFQVVSSPYRYSNNP